MVDPNIAVGFVVLLRALIPFTILRWPLLGGILAMISDGIDIMVFQGFGYAFLNGIPYNYIDKTFDTWYLFFEFLVVLRWKDTLAKRTAEILFSWRAIGYVIFLFVGLQEVFFFTPNIFEYFFLAMIIIWKFRPHFKLKKRSMAIILLIVGIPNIIKEYYYHVAANVEIWGTIRDHVFWWLYN